MFWTTRLFEHDFLYKIKIFVRDCFDDISLKIFLGHDFLDDIFAHTLFIEIFLGSLKLHKSVNVSNSTSYLCI